MTVSTQRCNLARTGMESNNGSSAGKFQGAMTATTPCGSLMSTVPVASSITSSSFASLTRARNSSLLIAPSASSSASDATLPISRVISAASTAAPPSLPSSTNAAATSSHRLCVWEGVRFRGYVLAVTNSPSVAAHHKSCQ